MFFNAEMTTDIPSKHTSVEKSKYSIYLASGMTKKQEIIAQSVAIISTTLFFMKDFIIYLLLISFTAKYYSVIAHENQLFCVFY